MHDIEERSTNSKKKNEIITAPRHAKEGKDS
jgi:hypothetical protein